MAQQDDTATGGQGTDTVAGGQGNDTVKAGGDAETVRGGDGKPKTVEQKSLVGSAGTEGKQRRKPSEKKGTGPETTQHGASAGLPDETTEIARVDGVDITRANQRLVSPRDHRHDFPCVANLPPGSEPTVIDPATGRPAEQQVAKTDQRRLDKLAESA